MCACICIHTSDCQAKHPSDEITHKCTWRTACHQLQLLVLRSSHYLLYHYYLCLQGFCSVYLLCSSPDCFPPPHLSDIIQPSFCSLLSPELLRLSPPSPHLLVSLVCIEVQPRLWIQFCHRSACSRSLAFAFPLLTYSYQLAELPLRQDFLVVYVVNHAAINVQFQSKELRCASFFKCVSLLNQPL